MNKAPFFAVTRHRINIDGKGVVTLVCFGMCPLRCKYCVNAQCFKEDETWKCKEMTPEELYQQTKCDELYFMATGGGLTFGGGEPLLRSDFIREFRTLCGPHWKLSVETSLNVPAEQVETLLPVIDCWIVDIKDMDPAVYQAYTGKDNRQVLDNLRLLAATCGSEKVKVRVPLIPDFNDETCRKRSVDGLREMGFAHFDLFEYKIKHSHTD